MKSKNSVKYMVVAAAFTSLITIFTAWLFHMPIVIGANTAYLHFGDAFIFIAASLLPTPYAVAAAAIGGGLADLLCGAAIWAPFTVIIKLLIALFFTNKGTKILCKRNLFALAPTLVITVAGYYVAEAILYGNWVTPVLSVFGNIVQIAGSGIIYVILSAALQKSNVKKLLS